MKNQNSDVFIQNCCCVMLCNINTKHYQLKRGQKKKAGVRFSREIKKGIFSVFISALSHFFQQKCLSFFPFFFISLSLSHTHTHVHSHPPVFSGTSHKSSSSVCFRSVCVSVCVCVKTLSILSQRVFM